MPSNRYQPADIPTMYFIGVTTSKSSIMRVFPKWAAHLGLGTCTLKGIDLAIHDAAEHYREAVDFIKKDRLSLGALVTTHKIDLLTACRDQFDALDEHADFMGEVSSISKRGDKLWGHAKDPITSGLSLDAFLPADHWARTRAEALVMGAGGSSIAVTWHLLQARFDHNRPSRIIVVNRSLPRLEEMRKIHGRLKSGISVEYVHAPRPEMVNALVNGLKPDSLVINATGLGKDAAGSPITDGARFPRNGYVWDFNYRGELIFLDQARRQQQEQGLTVIDGWVYFLHGWTRVIAEVFHKEIPTSGPVFDELSTIAAAAR